MSTSDRVADWLAVQAARIHAARPRPVYYAFARLAFERSARELPASGGETEFADLRAAYDARRRVDADSHRRPSRPARKPEVSTHSSRLPWSSFDRGPQLVGRAVLVREFPDTVCAQGGH